MKTVLNTSEETNATRAEQDLEDIWFYIAIDNPVAADGGGVNVQHQ